MYELTVMLITFFTVALSCWWLGDGDETEFAAETNPSTLRPTPHRLVAEQAGLGD